MAEIRVTKVTADVLVEPIPVARVTKVSAEVLVDPTAVARVTKVSVEVLVVPADTVACRWSLMGVGQR